MSANRSVQAAQRRRMGQEMSSTNNMRTPQPSINSAQMFNGQQQMPRQQQGQHMRQPQQQQMNQQSDLNKDSVSKLTIAQAITLITLRLGALEAKMMEPGNGMQSQYQTETGENMVAVDRSFMDSIMERLEALEKRPVSSSSNSNSNVNSNDITLMKQQFETIKQATIQTKNAVVSLTKENKDIKHNFESLNQELESTKELLNNIQAMVMDNNTKILNMTLGGNLDFNEEPYEQNFDGTTIFEDSNEISELDTEFIGTNLKELIENEINLEN